MMAALLSSQDWNPALNSSGVALPALMRCHRLDSASRGLTGSGMRSASVSPAPNFLFTLSITLDRGTVSRFGTGAGRSALLANPNGCHKPSTLNSLRTWLMPSMSPNARGPPSPTLNCTYSPRWNVTGSIWPVSRFSRWSVKLSRSLACPPPIAAVSVDFSPTVKLSQVRLA